MEKLGFVRRPIGGTEIFGEKIFSSGTLMVELSDHLVAVQDNVVFDTTDSSRSRSPKARRIKAIWYRTGQYPEPIGKEANNNEAILS